MKKILLICCLVLSGINAVEKPVLISTIPPLTDLVAQIAGDFARTTSLLPPGKSPHDYAFSPMDIAALAQAKIWFTIGLPLETPLSQRIVPQHPKLVLVDTRHGIKLLPMNGHHHHHESAEHEAESHHKSAHKHNHTDTPGSAGRENSPHHHVHFEHDEDDGLDPHIWLDPNRARQIAANICKGLCRVFPAQAEEFRANAAVLDHRLAQLDHSLQQALAPMRGKKIIVFHPAFGYFCERYGLRQMAIELDGHAPSPAWLGEVIRTAKAENIQMILVQPQFSVGSAQAAARAINGSIVEFDAVPADYLRYMQTIAQKLTPIKR